MKIVIGAFILLLGVAATAYFGNIEFNSLFPTKLTPVVADNPPSTEPRLPPPSLQALAAGIGNSSIPEQSEVDIIVDDQVRSASDELNSLETDTRIGAIEQLAAYPNRESERLIADVLRADSDDNLRSAAASALASIRNPSRETLLAVTAATVDFSEAVRQSALSTLEIYFNREPYGSPRTKIILNDLRQRLKHRGLPGDAGKEILEFINEHKP